MGTPKKRSKGMSMGFLSLKAFLMRKIDKKGGVKKNMATSNKKRLVKINFKAPTGCKEVKIAGDFTDWDKGAIYMSKSGRSGAWTASVRVEPGMHQYRFLLDGNWYTDPSTEHVISPFGSENSVLRVN
jgi:1,4-alpha-glucan branching enzyme